jgi:hypothetical protein
MLLALLLGLVVVFIIVLAWLQRTRNITEYLFFIRYPLMLGAALVIFPFAAPSLAPDSLTNIFVLNKYEVGVACFIAFLAGWCIVYVGRVVIVSVPSRCELSYKRDIPWQAAADAPPAGELMGTWWPVVAAVLALPVVVSCVVNMARPSDRWWGVLAAATGFVAAVGVRELARRFAALWERGHAPDSPTWIGRAGTVVPARFRSASSSLNPYSDLPRSIQHLHERAFFLFLATAAVYVLIGRFARPNGILADDVPAVAYLLILCMMMTWLLSAVAFLFDRSRVPGVGVAVLILLLFQSIFPDSHYFEVVPWKGEPPVKGFEAIQKRWESHGKGPLVAVAASGGGITASLWTAIVLNGLHSSIEGFDDRVVLTSSVSGGGIATMLYADEFTAGGPPSPTQFTDLVENAGTPSLNAAVWGIAYPDLWRVLLSFRSGLSDRGWAIEQRWGGFLADPHTTLSAWAPGVREGWRPLQIFNATLQETGGRLLLSAADLRPGVPNPAIPRMSEEVMTAYPGYDLNVVTAARLSATFPFVSPQASPEPGKWPTPPAPLHCADGGYFDNSGLYTALEVLNDYLDTRAATDPTPRIAIIEIRAANTTDPDSNAAVAASRGGLIDGVAGPLETLYNARVATQITRGATEFSLYQKQWLAAHQVTVERFVFHLTDRLPLSWNLTSRERALIHSHWPGYTPPKWFVVPDEVKAACEDNAKEVQRLAQFLRHEGALEPAPPDPGQTQLHKSAR